MIHKINFDITNKLKASMQESEKVTLRQEILKEKFIRLQIERDNWIREVLWQIGVTYNKDDNWVLKENKETGEMTLEPENSVPNLKIVDD